MQDNKFKKIFLMKDGKQGNKIIPNFFINRETKIIIRKYFL